MELTSEAPVTYAFSHWTLRPTNARSAIVEPMEYESVTTDTDKNIANAGHVLKQSLSSSRGDETACCSTFSTSSANAGSGTNAVHSQEPSAAPENKEEQTEESCQKTQEDELTPSVSLPRHIQEAHFSFLGVFG